MELPRLIRAADVAVVALLAASAQVQVWSRDAAALPSGPAVHATLAAAITLPLLVRHRFPLLVLCTIAVAGWLQYQLGGGLGQTWLAWILALYAVAAHGNRRDALLGVALTAVVAVVDGVGKLRAGDPWDEVVPAWFFLAGVWGFGRWMRWRRRELRHLQEQTEALERDRAESARAAVIAERARIARELHDLVAHSMGVIVIQSQAAQRVLRSDPTTAERALTSIEVAGRQGLAEMRRLLDVLIGSDRNAPLAPPPALRQLDTLLDQVRKAGLPVEMCIDGAERPLPPGLDLAVYRVIQEALTNTLRHAGPARAQVRLHYDQDGVDVEVTDDGAGAVSEHSGGHGLVGMAERVALYGGTLHTGRRPDGGFLVRAHLPFESAAAGPA